MVPIPSHLQWRTMSVLTTKQELRIRPICTRATHGGEGGGVQVCKYKLRAPLAHQNAFPNFSLPKVVAPCPSSSQVLTFLRQDKAFWPLVSSCTAKSKSGCVFRPKLSSSRGHLRAIIDPSVGLYILMLCPAKHPPNQDFLITSPRLVLNCWSFI